MVTPCPLACRGAGVGKAGAGLSPPSASDRAAMGGSGKQKQPLPGGDELMDGFRHHGAGRLAGLRPSRAAQRCGWIAQAGGVTA